jgi:23S rRNA (cytidine1920-2'-O)/16S rRNA (cytidine1409-2'-O)-methyltransferase
MSRAGRIRLDQAVADLGLAPSRSRAAALVMAGKVSVNGAVITKPGHAVPPDAAVVLAAPDHPYVSRGGVKLAGALDALGVDPAGLRLLDVGASTGGFTDCLLRRGARAVVALDVGYGQLAWSLRQDPRVTVIERVNFREIDPAQLGEPPEGAVVDVSFISLTLLLPRLVAVLRPCAPVVALVKPQFEAGRDEVGKGGVVRDPEVRARAIRKVVDHVKGLGCVVHGTAESVLPGPEGNREEFVHFSTPGPAVAPQRSEVQP